MEEILKKEYELSFLLIKSEALALIESVLQKEQGELLEKSELKEIKLAYPIKKQSSAYFGYIHFRLVPEAAPRLREQLKLTADVLRFLLITPPIIKPSSANRKPTASEKPVTPLDVPMPQVLSNEALEKKLEEILK